MYQFLNKFQQTKIQIHKITYIFESQMALTVHRKQA